jgi:hypothetical protein
MRRIRNLLGLSALLLLLLVLGGCTLTEKELKPPTPPEEFNAPPETDPRYSKPIEYPKDTMDTDALLNKAKKAGKKNGPPGATSTTPGRFGGY